jgi:hypothetical protein
VGRGEPNLAAVLAIILLFGLAVAAVTTAVYFKSIQEKKMSQVRKIYFSSYSTLLFLPRHWDFLKVYFWGSYHRVDRVLGLFSSCPNWDPPPPPPPTGESVPPPSGPWGDALACGAGVGGPNLDYSGQCGTPGIYVLCGFLHCVLTSL